MKKLFFLSMLFFLILSCSQEPTLSYRKIYDSIIQNTGQGIEWHGEDMNLEAKDSLQILADGSCEGLGCGDALFIENKSTQKVSIIVQAPFQIGEFESHLATKYDLPPLSKTAIGCAKLCIEDEHFSFDRKIVAAEYVQ